MECSVAPEFAPGASDTSAWKRDGRVVERRKVGKGCRKKGEKGRKDERT
jgi:hypothetical protein